MADQSRTIRLPVHLVEQVRNKLARISASCTLARVGTTDDELAAESGIPAEKIADLLRPQPRSGQPSTCRSVPTRRRRWATSSRTPRPPRRRTSSSRACCTDIRSVLATPRRPREQQVIRMRFGLDDGQPRTLDQSDVPSACPASGSARSRRREVMVKLPRRRPRRTAAPTRISRAPNRGRSTAGGWDPDSATAACTTGDIASCREQMLRWARSPRRCVPSVCPRRNHRGRSGRRAVLGNRVRLCRIGRGRALTHHRAGQVPSPGQRRRFRRWRFLIALGVQAGPPPIPGKGGHLVGGENRFGRLPDRLRLGVVQRLHQRRAGLRQPQIHVHHPMHTDHGGLLQPSSVRRVPPGRCKAAVRVYGPAQAACRRAGSATMIPDGECGEPRSRLDIHHRPVAERITTPAIFIRDMGVRDIADLVQVHEIATPPGSDFRNRSPALPRSR